MFNEICIKKYHVVFLKVNINWSYPAHLLLFHLDLLPVVKDISYF